MGTTIQQCPLTAVIPLYLLQVNVHARSLQVPNQWVEGAEGKKPLSVAIDELYKGKVKILAPEEEDEEGTEQTAEAQTEESAQASEITETAETAEETTAETTEE